MTGRPICEGHICKINQATSCACVKSRPLGVFKFTGILVVVGVDTIVDRDASAAKASVE